MSSSPRGLYNANKDDRHRDRGVNNGSVRGEMADWVSNSDWRQR